MHVRKNALAQRATLTRPIEANHGKADFGQRLQKWIKLLDERIIAGVENKCGHFSALRRQPKSWKVSTGIWDFDSLVAAHALHGESMGAGKIIVVAVSQVSGGEKKLGLMAISSRIRPAFLCFRTLSSFEKVRGPRVGVLDLWSQSPCF